MVRPADALWCVAVRQSLAKRGRGVSFVILMPSKICTNESHDMMSTCLHHGKISILVLGAENWGG